MAEEAAGEEEGVCAAGDGEREEYVHGYFEGKAEDVEGERDAAGGGHGQA